ncbi:alpha/beta fold hydrolase [Streptomyces colonosanans]|uniref:Non-ribosomal peptide synthetase n=1 Tax=Streptomyces colonosanans TaxID=1428652 RepID=A0A1S2NZJ3_9ACTN|nr:alpha/beta fold hydrolase [Streptomyces colonosanans]OIJ86696.1 non-ribosomal peptide synthetase [Streptomyces colonosanans]
MIEPSADSLVPLRATGSLSPLHCVHPVSGSPYCYAGLTGELDADRPVFGFEAPGFDGVLEPAGSIRKLAELHTATLRATRPHGPYRLLGWSLGGVVAYEMARLLSAAAEEVPLLVIVDAAVPQSAPLPPEETLARYFLYDFLGVTSDRAPGVDKAASGLPPGAQPLELFTAVEREGVVPEEFDAEFLLERYALFRTHVSALRQHPLEGVHHGPAVVIKAAESDDRLLDWSPHLSRLTEYTVLGDHHSIWQGEGLTAIGHIVNQALREVTSA